MAAKKIIQRTFILGDEWLFYKIYCGAKTADSLLLELHKIAERFVLNGIADKWFFIRYSDPKLHVRFRIHILQKNALPEIIKAFNICFKQYLFQNLAWKIQTDTYQREIERYGVNTMEASETIFFHESRMVVKALGYFNIFKGDRGEEMRWLFGIRAIDTMLDTFNFDIVSKPDLIKIFEENFYTEFNMNKEAKANLGKKYRKLKPLVNEVLNREKDSGNDMLPLFDMIGEHAKAIKPLADEINELNKINALQVPLNDLIGSYTHMLCNRLFRSKQRVHEMVLYTFLHKYYESEIAKIESMTKEFEPPRKKKIKENTIINTEL